MKPAKPRAAAMVGLAAVAAGGLGAGEAQAAGGKIVACYSKKSKVMQYSKGHCKPGTKKLSWNKAGQRGAVGPQGPQGAQGAAGAVAGYADYFSATSKVKPIQFPKESPVVAATFTPATAGYYAVDGQATIGTAGPNYVACHESNAVTHSIVPTERQGTKASSSFQADIATNGIVKAGPASPIDEVCFAFSNSGAISDAAVTGTQLSTAKVTGSTAALQGAKPYNRFSRARAFKK